MIRARGIQSVRSPWMRWPTTSNALQVLPPSFRSVQRSGAEGEFGVADLKHHERHSAVFVSVELHVLVCRLKRSGMVRRSAAAFPTAIRAAR